jgi:hypothetical protein
MKCKLPDILDVDVAAFFLFRVLLRSLRQHLKLLKQASQIQISKKRKRHEENCTQFINSMPVVDF